MTGPDIAGLIQRAHQELEGMRFPECLAALGVLEQMTRENTLLRDDFDQATQALGRYVDAHETQVEDKDTIAGWYANALSRIADLQTENKRLRLEVEEDVEIIASHVRVIDRLYAALRSAGLETGEGK